MKNCWVSRALFCVLVFCSGCHNKDFSSKAGTTRLYLQAEPFSLDPRVGGDRRSQVILRNVFEGLMRLDRKGIVTPGIAHSYSVSPDGLVYTFHLRDTVWSNGQKLLAQDFCYAWKSALAPQFSTPFAYAFFVIKNAKKAKMGECSLDEVGVHAVDDLTLQITLEHPTPYFLELTANPLYLPLCQAAVEADRDWAKNSFPAYVSNGPFVIKEHVFRSHMTLERNQNYWDADCSKSYRLSFPIIEHPSTAYALFEKGELDWFGDPCGLCDLEVIQKMLREGTMITKECGGIYWMVCCTTKPYLASTKIRQAIASSISRKDMCYLLLKGGERPANSVVPSSFSLLQKPVVQDGNKDFAKRSFEEGLLELGLTRETFPPITLTHWAEPLSKLMAQYVQQRIQSVLDITVNLTSCDWSTYMQKLPAGEIDIATAPWLSWVTDPMFNLQYLKYRNNGINGTCWQNAQYIELLEKAEEALDMKQRNEYLRQAEELVAQEVPLMPLFEMAYKYAKAPGVKGEVVSKVGMFDFKWLENE